MSSTVKSHRELLPLSTPRVLPGHRLVYRLQLVEQPSRHQQPPHRLHFPSSDGAPLGSRRSNDADAGDASASSAWTLSRGHPAWWVCNVCGPSRLGALAAAAPAAWAVAAAPRVWTPRPSTVAAPTSARYPAAAVAAARWHGRLHWQQPEHPPVAEQPVSYPCEYRGVATKYC